ncbi:prolipoprotein diacylglyceryl transferase [Mycobacterium intermedium]|nr:prolipoprotein diacylglyceryl transferase [Mycobacterium intermedium]
MTTTWVAYIPSPPRGVWHLGPVPIRAYAFFIIVGIVVALLISDRRFAARGGERGVVYDIALWIVPFGLVGGRLYHLATDFPTYFGKNGAGLAAALRVWDGGLGIWGAVALGAVGAWIGCRRRGISFPTFLDAGAPGLVLAQAIGRLGNYFNQELYGRETTLPWGLQIYYRRDPDGFIDVHSLDGVSTGQVAYVVHPTFLYELLWNLLVFAALIYLDRRYTIRNGRLFGLYVAFYCVGRFCVELLRDDTATHIAGIRINSFTSTFVFIGAVVYVLLTAPKGPREPELVPTRPGAAGKEPEPGKEPAAEPAAVAAASAKTVAAPIPEGETGEAGSADTVQAGVGSGADGEDVEGDEAETAQAEAAEAEDAEAEDAEAEVEETEVAEAVAEEAVAEGDEGGAVEAGEAVAAEAEVAETEVAEAEGEAAEEPVAEGDEAEEAEAEALDEEPAAEEAVAEEAVTEEPIADGDETETAQAEVAEPETTESGAEDQPDDESSVTEPEPADAEPGDAAEATAEDAVVDGGDEVAPEAAAEPGQSDVEADTVDVAHDAEAETPEAEDVAPEVAAPEVAEAEEASAEEPDESDSAEAGKPDEEGDQPQTETPTEAEPDVLAEPTETPGAAASVEESTAENGEESTEPAPKGWRARLRSRRQRSGR